MLRLYDWLCFAANIIEEILVANFPFGEPFFSQGSQIK